MLALLMQAVEVSPFTHGLSAVPLCEAFEVCATALFCVGVPVPWPAPASEACVTAGFELISEFCPPVTCAPDVLSADGACVCIPESYAPGVL